MFINIVSTQKSSRFHVDRASCKKYDNSIASHMRRVTAERKKQKLRAQEKRRQEVVCFIIFSK